MDMPPDTTPPAEYRLANQDAGIEVRMIVDTSGFAVHLFYRDGHGAEFEFQSGHISSLRNFDRLRAEVVLAPGSATEPKVTFEVLVPVVTFGDDVPDQGPFGVFGSCQRIEHFALFGDPGPGPRVAVETFALPGRALAFSPEADE